MQDDNNKKRPIIYYYLAVFVVLIIIQLIISPMITESRVKEIAYSSFVQLLDEGKVNKVQKSATGYTFEVKQKNGSVVKMKTGPWESEDLTKKLEEKGVQYTAEIPTTPNPLLGFLLTFLLPLALLWYMGRRIITQVQGSGAMSFGKSNAKVYVKAKSGKSFADVAGQDEAKDSLLEVVDFLANPGKYSEIGAVSPKGVLLVGPPGTGKTLLAQAVVRNLWSCSSAWARPRSVTCSKKPRKKRRASCLSMKLMRSANAAIRRALVATMNANRR